MRVAVFTGSQAGPAAHRDAAAAFAAGLARAGVGIVYGGGHVGLMVWSPTRRWPPAARWSG